MRVDPTEHPTHIGNTEPLSLTEQRVFGVDAQRCPKTGRVFEQSASALSRAEQTRLFEIEARRAAAKAAASASAVAAEAAQLATDEQKPALRLVPPA